MTDSEFSKELKDEFLRRLPNMSTNELLQVGSLPVDILSKVKQPEEPKPSLQELADRVKKGCSVTDAANEIVNVDFSEDKSKSLLNAYRALSEIMGGYARK